MKIYKLAIFSIAVTLWQLPESLYAQSLDLKTIVAASGSYTAPSGYSIDWVLGELVVGQVSSEGLKLSHGFLPQWIKDPTEVKEIESSLNIEIYPNPTSDWISINDSDRVLLKAELYDFHGMKLEELSLEEDNSHFIGNYPEGSYFLVVYTKTRRYQAFKIIKI